MSRWIGTTIVLSFFLVLLAGCKKQEDKLVEKKIELYDKMSEIMESGGEGQKMKPLMDELSKVEEDLKNHPGQQAAMDAHREELKAALERFSAAKRALRNKASGKKG